MRFENEVLSFAEVDALSAGMALSLGRRMPVRSMIGILASNGLLSLPPDFACSKARLVPVPLNPHLSTAEHEAMIRRRGVELVIYSTGQRERIQSLEEALPDLESLRQNRLAEQAEGLIETVGTRRRFGQRDGLRVVLCRPGRARAGRFET